MRIFYTLLYIHLLPLLVLRLFWRARKAPAYGQRIGERFALIPARDGKQPLIWIHAVSVGEVLAAIPLVRQLQQRYPQHGICITTTTPTGSERVRAALGDTVLHYYLPYDLPSLQMLFIRKIRPSLLMVMETELWPNLLAVCQAADVPAMLVNGRMSARSARGYRRFSAITRPMLQQLRLITAQSAQDAERFVALGAAADKLVITGSIKFDIALDTPVQQRLAALRDQLQLPAAARRCVIFASTHPGEDELIMPLVQRLSARFPALLAIVVPRHPERFSPVAALAQQQGLMAIKLSQLQPVKVNTQVIIGDSMGDMLALYGLADVAFIGGSLIKHGGHNMLEAAVWGLPVLSGRHVFNFQSVADALQDAGGIRLLDNAAQLEQLLAGWLADVTVLSGVGEAARQVQQQNQGALTKVMELAGGFLSS